MTNNLAFTQTSTTHFSIQSYVCFKHWNGRSPHTVPLSMSIAQDIYVCRMEKIAKGPGKNLSNACWYIAIFRRLIRAEETWRVSAGLSYWEKWIWIHCTAGRHAMYSKQHLIQWQILWLRKNAFGYRFLSFCYCVKNASTLQMWYSNDQHYALQSICVRDQTIQHSLYHSDDARNKPSIWSTHTHAHTHTRTHTHTQTHYVIIFWPNTTRTLACQATAQHFQLFISFKNEMKIKMLVGSPLSVVTAGFLLSFLP